MNTSELNSDQLDKLIKLGVGPRSSVNGAINAKYDEIHPINDKINDLIIKLSLSRTNDVNSVSSQIKELLNRRAQLVKPIEEFKLSLNTNDQTLVNFPGFRYLKFSDYVKKCFSK